MSSERPALAALAEQLGILADYRDVEGRDRLTSDRTREALAAAMGHEASDEAAALRSLEELERQARERIVEPVLVWREWEGGAPELHVNASSIEGARDYSIEITLEDGSRSTAAGRLPEPSAEGSVGLALPDRPPHGYHDVRLVVDTPRGERHAVQRLVMTPRTVLQPEEILGQERAFGVFANLYSVRSPGDWGHGGLRELTGLGRLAGEMGAAFVGINPLHAVANRGLEFSPYGPTSRLFQDVLYIDPEAVPELADSPAARALLDDPGLRKRRAALEASHSIDHEAVLDTMLPILQELHATFARAAKPPRKDAYASYREREGTALLDLATWECLAEHHAQTPGLPGTAWWRWPEPFRHPRSPAVEAFRRAHPDPIDFRCWLQFELDRQLAETADSVRSAGCALGIYQDLALGSSGASADTWMEPDLFAKAVHVGAPPDAYAPDGQDWGFPPFHPHRLRDDAYRPWSRLLRATFAHAGAVRIDHAMGLQRLFWIPRGRPGSEGAYVRSRADDLLGVLALESRRHQAVVVAEDLGTLPPGLPGLLADWGLLRSAVTHFERDHGRVRPNSQYPRRALASVGTHDLAPLAGYFDGTDLDVRRATGGFDSDADFEKARAERRAERASLVAALRAESLLPEDAEPDAASLRDALHAFVAASPSALVCISLDDLAGEREPVNVPGVPLESHRSWSRRMTRSLEELARSPEVGAAREQFRGRACGSEPCR